MKPASHKKPRPPLDPEALERIAIHYVGRYATTRSKLRAYLLRKVRERGWQDEGAPQIEALVERLAGLGYVDDSAFAASRAASLGRRGFGERRIEQALRAAGIDEQDGAEARAQAQDDALAAALRFARRKRIGPFAASQPDQKARARAFAAMLRAGHRSETARQVLGAAPGEFPEWEAP